MKFALSVFAIYTATFLNVALSHSIMTYPEPFTGTSCRLGGEVQFGVKNCKGPCDITRFTGERAEKPWSNHYPPNHPVEEVFRRGQKVTVKYTRNNHGPGGFNRFTLVRYRNETGPESAKDYMDKAIHTRNAFHYSCWGARPVVATETEKNTKYKYGMTYIGSDAQQHDQAAGYYVTDIVIPPVVPDGLYVLGWVWFGGTGGKLTTNDPQVPRKYSYFGDYWSCSFIQIKGGVPLAASYTPVFDNDYRFDKNAEGAEGMEDGCMAQNDKPGVCASEPCKGIEGFYRKPAAFKDGPPEPLTPANFGGEATGNDEAALASPSTSPLPSPSPTPSSSPSSAAEKIIKAPVKEEENIKTTATRSPMKVDDTYYTMVSPSPEEEVTMAPTPEVEEDIGVSFTNNEKAYNTCVCLYRGSRCSSSYAEDTYGCKGSTIRSEQPYGCKKVCCDLCKPNSHFFCEYMRSNYCNAL